MRQALAACALLLPALAAPAADIEDTLNARWRGGWALTTVPIQSDCAGIYTDNDVAGTQVRSRGARRFAAGESSRAASSRSGVKRARLDLFLDVTEPVIAPDAAPSRSTRKSVARPSSRSTTTERWSRAARAEAAVGPPSSSSSRAVEASAGAAFP